MSSDPCPGCGGCGTCLSRDRYWSEEGSKADYRYPILTVLLLAAVIFITWFTTAQAKDCYVQRWSYSTSVTCDDGDEALIMENNTRGRNHRETLPSQRRLPTTIYEDRKGNTTYCSQTGSIYSCR